MLIYALDRYCILKFELGSFGMPRMVLEPQNSYVALSGSLSEL